MKYLDNTGLAYFKDKLDTELATKQDSLVSGTNIKTVNNQSLLGSGNISITSGASNIENGTGTGSLKQAGNNTASGEYSFASGTQTIASKYGSHTEGAYTTASGFYSHAEGYYTTASGQGAHAEGVHTTAKGQVQHVSGQYNVIDNANKYIEIVGNGTPSANSNARTLDWNGNEVLAGKLTVGTGPTSNMDVATKQYVDTQTSSIVVPTKTSDLTNDSGFVDNTYHDSSKQDTLVSGTNIKTINNESLLGSGNITIQGGGFPTWGNITGTLSNQTDLQSVLDSKMPITDITDSTVRVYELDTGLYRIMGTSTNPITVYWKSGGYSFEVSSTEYLLLTINENATAYHFLTTRGTYFYEGYVSGSTSGFNKVLSDRDIKDVLTSTDTKSVLSANQGKILNESKQDTLVSGTNIKTINGDSILGSGNLDILNMVYPVGSIYMSVNSTSPATLFGGTWVAISQGRTLVGVGTGTDINGNTMTWTAEATGGEYLHTLTVDEIPSHHHDVGWDYEGATGGGHGTLLKPQWNNPQYQYDTSNTGGGQPHNNLQPFFAVYMWKRTA